MLSRKRSRRLDSVAKLRAFRPRLEALEDRTVMSVLGLGNTAASAALGFDGNSGTQTLLGGVQGTQARIAVTGNAVAVTVNGQLPSSDAGSSAFHAARAGLNAPSL